MKMETIRKWSAAVMGATDKAFPIPCYSNWPTCHRLLPQAVEVLHTAHATNLRSKTVADLSSNCASYLQDMAEYDLAEPMYRLVLSISDVSGAAASTQVASDLTNLSHLLLETGRASEAEPLLRRALGIDEQLLDPDHV